MGFLDTLKSAFKFDDDDDDEAAFEEYEEKEKEKELKNEQRQIHKARNDARDTSANDYRPDAVAKPMGNTSQKVHTVSNYNTTTYVENRNNSKSLRIERPQNSKVIPISATNRGNEVCVMKPIDMEDSQDICDVLLSGRIAIVNLEGADKVLAQRTMDFISGTVYSINGKLFPISNLIYIITPEQVDISGDYNELIEQSGFDIPNFV
ncbi:MAG: cell division protein SepF [Lachnospiraceae bacterium]|nr:cell division protein SepF [Lachnospiraceae bacterium]